MVLVAPAGYGKTYIAQRVAREETWESIDCSLPDADATAVISRIRTLAPENGDGGAGVTVILESCDALADGAGQARNLAAALADLPARTRVVLCARSDVVLRCVQGFAPHTVTLLQRDDLAFDENELRQLFAADRCDDATFLRVNRLLQGWPAAALFVDRVWNDLPPDALLHPSETMAFAGLLEYVSAEIITPLAPPVLRALASCVAAGDATDADIDRGGTNHARKLVRDLQLARYGGDRTIQVHPLIAEALKHDRYQLLGEQLADVAARAEEGGDYMRAARCYVQAGNAERAAESLRRDPMASFVVPSAVYEQINAQFRSLPYLRYPEIWVAFAPTRRLMVHPEVLAHEGRTIMQVLEVSEPSTLFYRVAAQTSIALRDCGWVADAARVLEHASEGSAAAGDDAASMELLAARISLQAHLGTFSRGPDAWPRLREISGAFPVLAAEVLSVDIRAARARGRWELEFDAIEQLTAQSQRSRSYMVVAYACAEGVFGAWIAGDNEAFETNRSRLHDVLRQQTIPGLANLLLAVDGRRPSGEREVAPLWDARAFLIASTQSDAARDAAQYVRRALELADQAAETFTRILARVAMAEKVSTTRKKMLAEALTLCEEVESPELLESVRNLAETGEAHGLLAPLVNRLRASSGEIDRTVDAPVEIRLAGGSVRRGDNVLQISVGGMALLVALAIESRPLSTEVLCDRLWPDTPFEQAYKALKMCVHRTRGQLHDAAAIETTEGGYTLAAHVAVDIRFLPRILDAVARGQVTGPLDAQLDTIFADLAGGRPASFANWEWFERAEALLERATREIGGYLGRRALRGGDHVRALEIAHELTRVDSLDEAAIELVISAHLAAGDRSAAILEFRRYQRRLAEEMRVEPSPHLKRLLDET